MDAGTTLRIIMIFTGVFLTCSVTWSLAKKKMIESFCLTWGLLAVCLILAGILLNPSGINRYISTTGLWLAAIIVFCALYVAYFISAMTSQVSRKNTELTLQVALLKKENEEMKEKLDLLSESIEKK